MLRPEEEAAAKMLQGTLTELGVESTWRPGDDPPDVVFEVKDRGRWAVEVTALYQYFQKDGSPESRRAATEPIIRMCENLQAQIGDLVNTDYLIVGFGPIRKPSLREVEKRAIEYIRSGKSDEKPLDDEGRVRISRQTEPVRVHWMSGLHHSTRNADGKSISADCRATVSFALERILNEKLPDLATTEGYERKMLLIVSEYVFAEPQMVKEILDTRSLTREQVDTILFIADGKVHWVADPGGVFVQPRNTRADSKLLAVD